MIPNADLVGQLQLAHRHPDGTSHPMQAERHDPAKHDPEQSWLRGQRFVCLDCQAAVTLVPNEKA